MQHLTSTLATTACAVFGLVAAAHILHPGNYEAPPARPNVAAVAAAWVDPPADLRVAAPPRRAAEAGAPPVASELLVPRMAAAIPPGQTMAPTLASAIVAPVATPTERMRKVAAVRRRKPASRTAPTRQASLDRDGVPPQPIAAQADTAQKKSRIDPIGDLIRGLGFGGEG